MRTKVLRGREDVTVQLVHTSTLDSVPSGSRCPRRFPPPVGKRDLGSVPAGWKRSARARAVGWRAEGRASSGVALVAALVSSFTGRPVRADLAMTDEITLSGHSLPVAGVKEKALGACCRGSTHVVPPRQNGKYFGTGRWRRRPAPDHGAPRTAGSTTCLNWSCSLRKRRATAALDRRRCGCSRLENDETWSRSPSSLLAGARSVRASAAGSCRTALMWSRRAASPRAWRVSTGAAGGGSTPW